MNNWSQTPLTSLLIAPFVGLFIAAAGGTEGVMLFLLLLAFLFCAAISFLTWYLLRQTMEPFWAAIFCFLFFLCNYGYNWYLDYTSISQTLLALGGALLWNALCQKEPRAAAVRYAWAGLVMALCALAHVIWLLYIVAVTLLYGTPTPGFPTLACLLLMLGGSLHLSLGVMGQYLAKTYLETKRRPLYIVKETEESVS